MKIAETCALRAPTVVLVRINTIRTKTTVMDKGSNRFSLSSYKIANCVRTGFSSVQHCNSAATGDAISVATTMSLFPND
jgi:hypothetical protein